MLPLFFMQSSDSLSYKKIANEIREQTWVVPGKRVLVACSGGLDSTFLLNVLNHIPALSLGVIHLNHGLRGRESDADARFVQNLAESKQLPYFSRKIDLKADPDVSRLGLEATARKQRYTYFHSVREMHHYDVVATAHTGSDLIETVLLNLVRGTGISGLRGIASVSDTIVRPIINFTRQQIEEIAEKSGMLYRMDASNTDWRFTRNRIRHGWLEHLNSAESQSLLTEMLKLRVAANEIIKLIEESCNKLEKQQVKTVKPGKILLDIPRGADYFSALWKALFDKAFQHVTGIETGLSECHYRSVMLLLEHGQSGDQITLPKACIVFRERSQLCFVKAGLDDWHSTNIRSGERRTISFFRIKLETANFPATLFTDKATQYLPYQPDGWLLRPWETGDLIVPFGHSKRVKVSDLLQAAKVAPHLKRCWPVMVQGHEIVWIPGVIPSESARITSKTRHVLKVEIALETESTE